MSTDIQVRRPHPRGAPMLHRASPTSGPRVAETTHCRRASRTFAKGAALLLLFGACARPRHPGHPGQAPDSPQAALEAQLIRHHSGTRRTHDGGLVYTAVLTAGSPETLRVPYELLKLECDNHGGRFTRLRPPERSAVSLSTLDTPAGLHKLLVDADRRQIFGEHQCTAGENVWFAEIEPIALLEHSGLQLYVRASTADDYDAAAPLGPGLPALGAVPKAASVQPSTADARPAAAPLDEQPPRPSREGDRLLADPQPFGVSLGTDSPEKLAKKLQLELAQAHACDDDGLQGLCWDKPSTEAQSVRALFADLGSGPVLASLEVRYPVRSYGWLARTFQGQFGPPDSGDAHSKSWSWLHTLITLAGSDTQTVVNITHKPSLDRARLPLGSAARQAPSSGRVASPWQLQLGYESAQAAQAKLQAAGFSIAASGCSDGDPRARPVLTRTCPLRGGNLPGVRGAWVRIVDMGDGRPRLAELGYTFDSAALDETSRDLIAQYGEPIPSEGGQLQWWTGGVGITLTPSSDAVTLRYYHGRLLQYFLVAEEKRQAAKQAIPRRGL